VLPGGVLPDASIQNNSGLPQKCRTQARTSTCAVDRSHLAALATKDFFQKCRKSGASESDRLLERPPSRQAADRARQNRSRKQRRQGITTLKIRADEFELIEALQRASRLTAERGLSPTREAAMAGQVARRKVS